MKSPYGPYHSQRETQELIVEHYKQIQTKMNAMKKKLYLEANQQYLQSKQSTNKKHVMSYGNLKDMKDQIEFDVAWLTFDEVNKHNDTSKIIDLTCLEIKDALVIVFSQIQEVA